MPTSRTVIAVILLSLPLALSHWWPPLALLTVAGDLALALVLAVDWQRLRAIEQVEAERECPEILSLGVPNPVQLRLRSRAGMGLRAQVADDPPKPFGFGLGMAAARLAPYGEWAHGYHLVPHKRGDYAFGNLYVRFTTRLGLVSRQRSYELARPVRVYPNVAQLREYELLARRDLLSLMGLHRLRRPATALEFDSLRDYMPDDELRRVDWKATARRGKLVVKQYDIERMQTLLVLLDCGRTMASDLEGLTKLDYAVNASVLLTHVAAGMDDRVGLLAFADEIMGYLPPGRGRQQSARVTDFLYPIHPHIAESDYRAAFSFVSGKRLRRSLVVVFTDLLDPDSSSRLLRYLPLLARRHYVLCVALSDWELRGVVRAVPEDVPSLYRQTVALSLLQDRERAIALMSRRGVAVLNAAPSDLSVATVNRYLELKRGGVI